MRVPENFYYPYVSHMSLAGRRLLLVSPWAYHPACGNGGGVICYRFLEGLAARYDVHLIAQEASKQNDVAASVAIEALGVKLTLIPRVERSRLKRSLYKFQALFGGMPLEAREFQSRSLELEINRIILEERRDVVILQFPHMVQYASRLKCSVILGDAQDAFFVSKLRSYSSAGGSLLRLKKLLNWISWVRYEMENYAACDLIMTLTEQDKVAMNIMLPHIKSFVNEPVTVKRKSRGRKGLAGKVLGFAGNFRHPPNLEAFIWLNDAVAPEIRRRDPEIVIHVAGMGLPEEIQNRLHPAIKYLDFVDDYDRFLDSCSVFVAPLLSGGGVKIKVIEALSTGCPVVATSIGAEGIPLSSEEGLMVADEVEGFVDRVTYALEHHDVVSLAAEKGAGILERRFGVESRMELLEAQLSTALSQKSLRSRHPSQQDA